MKGYVGCSQMICFEKWTKIKVLNQGETCFESPCLINRQMSFMKGYVGCSKMILFSCHLITSEDLCPGDERVIVPLETLKTKCAEAFYSFSPMMWITEKEVGGIFFAIWKINLISKQTRRKGRPKNNILIVGFRRVVIKEVIYRFTQIYQQYFRLFGGLFPQLEKLWVTKQSFCTKTRELGKTNLSKQISRPSLRDLRTLKQLHTGYFFFSFSLVSFSLFSGGVNAFFEIFIICWRCSSPKY